MKSLLLSILRGPVKIPVFFFRKRIGFVISICAGLAGVGLTEFSLGSKTVTFQSLESKTGNGGPVFNEIRFESSADEDVWIMRQSHHGLNTDRSKWDHLAIVVDKSVTPKHATFYQLSPGELTFSKTAKVIPFDAECVACHANGPRAIRPSSATPLDLMSRLKVMMWNTKIAAYDHTENHEAKHFTSGFAFQSPMPLLQQKLNLNSCTECHSEKGSRASLHIAQISTIEFLVKNKLMPPDDSEISQADLELINKLTR